MGGGAQAGARGSRVRAGKLKQINDNGQRLKVG